MKIPKKLKICGYTYQVKRLSKENSGTDKMGSCSCGQAQIFIADDISQEQQQSTLLHEALEAINFHYKLSLEERDICTLETGLYQFLKDNKLWAPQT